jgi:hypothetical protein
VLAPVDLDEWEQHFEKKGVETAVGRIGLKYALYTKHIQL